MLMQDYTFSNLELPELTKLKELQAELQNKVDSKEFQEADVINMGITLNNLLADIEAKVTKNNEEINSYKAYFETQNARIAEMAGHLSVKVLDRAEVLNEEEKSQKEAEDFASQLANSF